MKVSTEWLSELVKLDQPIDQLAESLSIAGFEVEEINHLYSNAEGVVVGFVEKVDKHPNAEKLSVCSVDIGLGDNLQIVCGAPNVRQGVHVLVATVGAYLSSISLKIKSSELRGIRSNGMICSLKELGINSSSKGICILEENYADFPKTGEPVIQLLGLDDSIVDLAITANRPDGMSMVGISREISALTKNQLTLPKIDHSNTYTIFSTAKSENNFPSVDIYTLTHITGITSVKESPKFIKDRLEHIGFNSINLIVDLTNYLMVEQGQPLHAYDSDKLSEIIGRQVLAEDFGIRKARAGELFIGLDNIDYHLTESCSIITCGDVPIALAGVIGSNNSSVTNKTRAVWIESAVFPPSMVRNNSRAIGVRTESSSRFEKGISSLLTIGVSKRASEEINKLCGSTVKGTFTTKSKISKNLIVTLRRNRIHKILGPVVANSNLNIPEGINNISTNSQDKILLSDKEIVDILTSLDCFLVDLETGWEVTIPPHRSMDLLREIDLIEEIARLIGYDKFDTQIPNPLAPGCLEAKQLMERKIRVSFCNLGFQEIVSSSLVAPKDAGNLSIRIENPLLAETSQLRTNIWNEHLRILNRNISSGLSACWIYEVGKIYNYVEEKYEEEDLLCGAMNGWNSFGQWSARDKSQKLDYFSARGKLLEALDGLNVRIIDKGRYDDVDLHPGRAASLYIEGKFSGRFGQVHPLTAERFSISADSFIFELKLKNLLDGSTRRNVLNPIFKQYPTVPSMERDIAIIHHKDHTSAEIINAIKKAGSPILENAELIDRYEGEKLPECKIGQAFRITYRNKKRTLTDNDVNPIHEKIRSILVSKFKAELRS